MLKIHFIGIGGIGVSALARYYLSEGYSVSGSDLVASDILDELKHSGANICVGNGHEGQITDDLEAVVYSAAVPADDPELKKANDLGVKTLSYAEVLGELTQKYFTLAISGTHGKSTTTSMLALMMIEAGLDPTVIVGTKVAEFGNTNFRKGKSRYLVIEADEYNRSFLQYRPQITVINNIDKDHLDTYGDIKGVVEGFNRYLKNLSREAVAILNAQDDYTEAVVAGVQCKLAFFNHEEAAPNWPLALPGHFNQ